MLHRCILIGLFCCLPMLSFAGNPERLKEVDLIQAGDRVALQNLIVNKTVSISVIATGAGDFVTPAPRRRYGLGWMLDEQHILTAALLVSEGTHEVTTVEINNGNDPRPAHAVYLDHRTGVAILRIEKADRKLQMPAKQALKDTVLDNRRVGLPDKELMRFWLGRPVFAASDGGVPYRLVLGLPLPGALSYFWVTQGHLQLGTPLTDARGRLLSMIGLIHRDHPGVLFVLPRDAIETAIEQFQQATE